MNRKYKLLFKDIVIFAIGSLGSKLILFILVPLYTNYLSTAEYGTADLVSTFASLIVPVASIAINRAIIRFGMKKGERPQDVIKTTFIILCGSAIVAFFMCHALRGYTPIREWRYYLFAQVVLENFFEAEKTYLKVKDKNRILAMISILDTLVLATTNFVLLSIIRLGIQGYLTAIIVSKIFGCAVGFIACNLFHDFIVGKFDKSLAKRMIVFSFPLIFSDISYWIIHSTDKLMIEWMLSASALGLYTVATKIPSLINVMISIFIQAWGISSIKEIESTGDTSFYSYIFNLYNFVMFGACILIVTFIKPFMNIYVGTNFKDAWMYTPLLLVAAVYFSFTVFVSSLYAALNKSKNDMWTSLLCAATNISINYFAIQSYGVWGAIIGTVVAYLVCAIVRIIDIRSIIKFEVHSNFIINILLILIQGVAVSIQWNPYIVSVVILSIFILLNKKEVTIILNKIFQIIDYIQKLTKKSKSLFH